MRHISLRALFPAVAAAALASCAAVPDLPPPPPTMSPYPAGGHGYGYAEERIGPDLLRVVYHGPWRPLDYDAVPRRAQLDRAASAAADLALWRAAQLALAEGKPAFTVIERRADTETNRSPGYVYDPWWPHYAYPHGYGPYYWPYYRPWPPAYYVPGAASGRARVVLTVRLAGRATAANIDAAATIRRFERAYGPPGARSP